MKPPIKENEYSYYIQVNKLLLTTVDMDCIEYWNLYSN